MAAFLSKRAPVWLLLPLATLLCASQLAGCGDDADDETPDAGTDTTADTTPVPDTTEDVAPTEDTTPSEDTSPGDDVEPGEDTSEEIPDLQAIYQSMFEPTCGGLACHTGGGQAGGLALDLDEGLVDRLLAISSAGIPQVEPGNPENSYLYLKSNGSFREVGGSGSRMPLASSPLTEAELAELRAFIENWEP